MANQKKVTRQMSAPWQGRMPVGRRDALLEQVEPLGKVGQYVLGVSKEWLGAGNISVELLAENEARFKRIVKDNRSFTLAQAMSLCREILRLGSSENSLEKNHQAKLIGQRIGEGRLSDFKKIVSEIVRVIENANIAREKEDRMARKMFPK